MDYKLLKFKKENHSTLRKKELHRLNIVLCTIKYGLQREFEYFIIKTLYTDDNTQHNDNDDDDKDNTTYYYSIFKMKFTLVYKLQLNIFGGSRYVQTFFLEIIPNSRNNYTFFSVYR